MNNIIDDIKDKVDILELVEETVQLKRSGRNYTGFCPFHNNTNTPALVVFPETSTWKCFGCNSGGSVFDWVMHRDNTDFRGALHMLANLSGIEVQRSPQEIERYQKQATLKTVMTFASDYFAQQLWLDDETSRHALETRARRGFNDEVLHAIGWGYSRGDDGLMRAMMDEYPEYIPTAREYGLIRRDGRDFTANAEGNKISPQGWIIYPHYERGILGGQVLYLSGRAVSNIEKGSKSRNLPDAVEIYPYLLFAGASRQEDDGVHTAALADDIIIVEGQADAATAWALGWPAAALLKTSFNPKFMWLKKYLSRAQGRGAKIFVGLSNDNPGLAGALGQWKNGDRQPGVCEAISPLASVLYWPRPNGHKKSDANSWYLAGGNAEAMNRMLGESLSFLEMMIEETGQINLQTRRIKHLAELVARLNEDARQDYINLITNRSSGIKVNKSDFKKYVREAMLSRNGNGAFVEITNGQFSDYGEPLASCLMKITHQQLIHAKNEEEATIRYKIVGWRPDNRYLKPVEVPADSFDDFKWMAKNWGVDGYVMVGKNKLNKLKTAVINYSLKDIQREEIYSYTGWETIDGRWGYLTGSGLLTAEGLDPSIKVELEGTQRIYQLPSPPDEVSIVEAALASLGFLDIGPNHITVPLLLAQYAAPLRPLQSFNALIILYGPSQAKKSNISYVALCHWGNFLTGLSRRDYHTVIDAASTSIMLQKYNHLLSDTVVVVDDVPPGSSNFEIIQQRKKVETLARELGNRAGRERHGFASLPPNAGICMITAEKLAMQVGSAVGRSFTIEFTRDSINVQRLSQAQQKDSYLYSQSMAGYIQWLALNRDDLETNLPQRVREFQQEVAARYSQPRLHDYYATLMAAGSALLTWSREIGAIDELAELAYLERFREGVMTNLDSQEERIAEMQFSRRFFETLATILVQKPRAFVPLDGYIYADEFGQSHTTYEPPPGTPLLGWLAPEAGQVYLHDAEALKVVKRHLQEMGEFLDVSVNDLRKEMDYLGLLAETETYARKSGRTVVQFTPKKKLPARGWTRVLVVNNSAVKNLFDINLLQDDEK
jgi:DNA primase catalytic core